MKRSTGRKNKPGTLFGGRRPSLETGIPGATILGGERLSYDAVRRLEMLRMARRSDGSTVLGASSDTTPTEPDGPFSVPARKLIRKGAPNWTGRDQVLRLASNEPARAERVPPFPPELPEEKQPVVMVPPVPERHPGRLATLGPEEPAPSIPTYKSKWFAHQERQESWQDWWQASLKLPDVTFREANAYAEILAAEGGLVTDGTTVAGITQSTLSSLIALEKLPDVPVDATPTSLTNDQRVQVYRAYMEDVLKGNPTSLFAALPSDASAASFADLLFRGGTNDAGRVLRSAINTIIPGSFAESGAVNGDLIQAFLWLANDPDNRWRLSDEIIAAREARWPGETPRNRHFAF